MKADPVLLAQLLENLLDNALKYSRDGIELEVRQAGHVIQVAVHDRGPGIPPRAKSRPSSSRSGAATVPASAGQAWAWRYAGRSRAPTGEL